MGQGDRVLASTLVSLLYIGDFVIAYDWLPIADAYVHIWSLAIEEQFYFVWPAAWSSFACATLSGYGPSCGTCWARLLAFRWRRTSLGASLFCPGGTSSRSPPVVWPQDCTPTAYQVGWIP